jgi:hypothetical protein
MMASRHEMPDQEEVDTDKDTIRIGSENERQQHLVGMN